MSLLNVITPGKAHSEGVYGHNRLSVVAGSNPAQDARLTIRAIQGDGHAL